MRDTHHGGYHAVVHFAGGGVGVGIRAVVLVVRRHLRGESERQEGLWRRILASHAMRTQQNKRCLERYNFLSFKGGELFFANFWTKMGREKVKDGGKAKY
jgi:hypothetical protein